MLRTYLPYTIIDLEETADGVIRVNRHEFSHGVLFRLSMSRYNASSLSLKLLRRRHSWLRSARQLHSHVETEKLTVSELSRRRANKMGDDDNK